MKTDYAAIADTYDQGYKRKVIPVSTTLEALVAKRAERRALDVGCGTGNWLEVQRRAFETVKLTGVDPSPHMLARARAKLPEDVTLGEAAAESLPFDDDAFDLVVSNFTFHHFEDKDAALDELIRVSGEAVDLWNICPQHMPGWWVFHFFPAAVALDEARFWSPRQVFDGLSARGLDVEVEVAVRLYATPMQELLEEARRRDVSQIALLEEDAYEEGLRAMERTLAESETFIDQIALLTARAHR